MSYTKDKKTPKLLKGALDNILKFPFWLIFIYHVLQIQKEKFKNSF